jgi:hypothetical protein
LEPGGFKLWVNNWIQPVPPPTSYAASYSLRICGWSVT